MANRTTFRDRAIASPPFIRADKILVLARAAHRAGHDAELMAAAGVYHASTEPIAVQRRPGGLPAVNPVACDLWRFLRRDTVFTGRDARAPERGAFPCGGVRACGLLYLNPRPEGPEWPRITGRVL